MNSYRARLLGAVLLWTVSSTAYAIPSPVAHVHDAKTVSWKDPGSPALPWDDATADKWNHNHLTADPFDNFQKWLINKAWDNRTLHSSVVPFGPTQFGPGLIQADMPVHVEGDSTVPADAMKVTCAGYKSWISKATDQFNAKKDPWDRLAINFQVVDKGDSEIGVRFVDSLPGAYAEFNASSQLVFVKDPQVTVATDAATKRIRKKGEMTNSTSISYATPWEYTGKPDLLAKIPIEFSDDSGMTWSDTAPIGFGDLKLIAGDASTTTPSAFANPLQPFDMDFPTIALHEIGHSIGLGHAIGGIMAANIAQSASFGSTLGIDDKSALAVAIDYTYSVPEPASVVLLVMGIAGLVQARRGASKGRI